MHSPNDRVIQEQKAGGREAQELERFRVGGRATRAKRSQDASMASVTGTCDAKRAWRPVCALIISTTVSHLLWLLLDLT